MFSVLALILLLLAGMVAAAIAMGLRGDAGLSVARVIGDATRAIGRAPLTFALLAMMGAIGPVAGLFTRYSLGLPVDGGSVVLLTGLVGTIVPLMTFVIFQVAIIAVTLEALDGQPQFLRTLRRVPAVILPALAAILLYWIAVGAGLLLFFVPGVILACVWMLVLPVLVAERPGVIAAFGRAAKLSAGVRGPLFLLAIVGLVFGAVVQAMIGALAALLGAGSLAQVATMLATALLAVLPPALVASAYRQRVSAIEGPRRHELERIFA